VTDTGASTDKAGPTILSLYTTATADGIIKVSSTIGRNERMLNYSLHDVNQVGQSIGGFEIHQQPRPPLGSLSTYKSNASYSDSLRIYPTSVKE
jgi:hypothetical protein